MERHPFERTFEDAEAIPRDILDAQLADPDELSGVLNKALAVHPRLRDPGLTETESMERAFAGFRQTTDRWLSGWRRIRSKTRS